MSQLLLPAVFRVAVFQANSAVFKYNELTVGNCAFLGDVSSPDLSRSTARARFRLASKTWKAVIFTCLHKSRLCCWPKRSGNAVQSSTRFTKSNAVEWPNQDRERQLQESKSQGKHRAWLAPRWKRSSMQYYTGLRWRDLKCITALFLSDLPIPYKHFRADIWCTSDRDASKFRIQGALAPTIAL